MQHLPPHQLEGSRREAVTNSFTDDECRPPIKLHLAVFEGALNLPSLVGPLSRPRDPALFVPALLDRPSAEWWQVKE
jgi:hypothetical protein